MAKVGRHYQPGAGRMHLAHLLHVEHRARAHHRVRQLLHQHADAVERLRRIQRHLDQPEAAFDQRAAHGHGFARRDAAQDGHERKTLEE